MADRLVRILFLLVLAIVSWSGPAARSAIAQRESAAAAPDGSASDGGQNAFRAVPGGGGEQISGARFMMAAYALIWFLVLAYVFRLARLQALSEREQRRLERLLASRDEPSPGGEDRSQP